MCVSVRMRLCKRVYACMWGEREREREKESEREKKKFKKTRTLSQHLPLSYFPPPLSFFPFPFSLGFFWSVILSVVELSVVSSAGVPDRSCATNLFFFVSELTTSLP